MKKSLLAVTVLTALAVAYPSASWVTGKRLEAKLAKLEGQDILFSNFKVVKQTYTRGIFSSTQESTIELDIASMSPKAEPHRFQENALQDATQESHAEASAELPEVIRPKPLQLQVINHIVHGPIPGIVGFAAGKIETELVLDASTLASIKKVFGNKKFLEIRTVLHYTGGGRFRISSPAVVSTVGPSQDKFDWKGLNFEIGFDATYKKLQFDLLSPGLEMIATNGSANLKIGEIKLQGEATRAYPDSIIYLGTTKATINHVSFSNAQASNKGLILKDVELESTTSSKNDLIDSHLKMGIQDITMNDLKIGRFHYDYSLRNLHGPSFNQFIVDLRKLESQKNDPDAMLEIEQNWKKYAIEILKHDPVIALDRLGLIGKGGEFKASASLRTVGVTESDFDTPQAVLAKIEGLGEIQLDDGLVDDLIDGSQSSPEARNMMRSMFYSQIQTWETQGFINHANKQYKAQISWKEGQFLVNGKPFPALPADQAGIAGGAPAPLAPSR
ncbi:YdgA family protein [Undibacterium fentianense]|uniref:YdgA family protein n=1 Tax=Undibacterium fentianense TaxID=2828728 RepID=A0A941IE45_9BURK|nr:YdgA family protein [Undibacterium fentianense]MBR7800688.1 YdgA family protein [Undibacterium fentianense]